MKAAGLSIWTPGTAAAYAVVALQPLVCCETDPADSAVVTVARLSNGMHAHSQVHSVNVTILSTQTQW